jgi:hypothetical protein
VDDAEWKKQQDEERETLWRAIGGVDALSNPDGRVGSMISAEDRLNRIWDLVKDLRPEQS